MARIDYYFSPFSVFTYLAGNRLEQIADRHGASIAYKPMDLMAVMGRTGGVALAERHPSRLEYRMMELKRIASEQGVPINPQPMFFPTNPAPAAYAIIAAQKAGGGDTGRLAQCVLRACWAEERNIADDETIRGCLAEAGFDPSVADSGMLAGAEIYARNTEDAVNAGVFGSPFYITDDGARFWGQDRLEALDRYLGK